MKVLRAKRIGVENNILKSSVEVGRSRARDRVNLTKMCRRFQDARDCRQ